MWPQATCNDRHHEHIASGLHLACNLPLLTNTQVSESLWARVHVHCTACSWVRDHSALRRGKAVRAAAKLLQWCFHAATSCSQAMDLPVGVLASSDAVEQGLRVASYMLTRLHNKCLRRHSRPLAGAKTARSSGVLVLITRGQHAAGLEVGWCRAWGACAGTLSTSWLLRRGTAQNVNYTHRVTSAPQPSTQGRPNQNAITSTLRPPL